MRRDVIFVINDLFIRCGEVLVRCGHVGVPHVHRDGLDAAKLFFAQRLPKAVQAGLAPSFGDKPTRASGRESLTMVR